MKALAPVARLSCTLWQTGKTFSGKFARAALRFFATRWEYILAAFVLLTLVLFLLGNNLLGYDKEFATILAIIGTLVTTLLTFLLATLVMPLLMLVGSFVAALVAAVAGLLTLLVGAIVTPIIAVVTGLISSAVAWFMTTWLGTTLVAPVYSIVGPLILKIAPWLTATRTGKQAWEFAHKHPKLRKLLGLKKPAKRSHKK